MDKDQIYTPEQASLFGNQFLNSGTPRMLRIGDLNCGLPYQRPVRPHKVNKMVREWDARLLSPLIVSHRDGRFNIVDGQHRVSVVRKLGGGDYTLLQCLVFEGMTYEQEAELYYKLDQANKRLTLAHSIHALLESGKSEECRQILLQIETYGFKWALGKARGKQYEITTTRAILKTYRDLGNELFGRMLWLMNGTWHGEPSSLSAAMISGMALFLKTYETELDDFTFVRRLSVRAPADIVRHAKADYSTNKMALRVGKIILSEYNSGHGKRLAYRFKD